MKIKLNNQNRWIGMGLVLWGLLTSCHYPEQMGYTANRNKAQEIVFSCAAVTKTTQEGMKTLFKDGDRIGVYAVIRKEGETVALKASGNYVDNLPFRYVAKDNSFVAEGDKIYLSPGYALDFYVYYPYRSVIQDATAIPHTTGTRQDTVQEYTESDFLTAVRTGYTNAGSPIALQFTHRMAQLEVHIAKTAVPIESLLIKKRKNQSRIHLGTGVVTLQGDNQDVYFRKYQETATGYTFRAFLPPQVLNGQEELFAVKMQGGQTKNYKNSSSPLTLEAGKITTYTMALQSRIQVIAGEGGTVQVNKTPVKDGGVYNDGEQLSIQAIPNTGYLFSHWEENTNKLSETNPYLFTTNEPRTIYGQFKRGTSEITTELQTTNGLHPELGWDDVHISGDGSHLFGSQVKLEVHPGKGFEFVRWEDGITDNPRWITVQESKKYKAVVKRKSFKVQGSASCCGRVDGNTEVLYGEDATLTVVSTDDRYRFQKWSDGSISNPRTFRSVSENIYRQASFELVPKTYCIYVTKGAENGGEVYGAGCDKEYGIHELYVVCKPGYESDWEEDRKLVWITSDHVTVRVNFYYTGKGL